MLPQSRQESQLPEYRAWQSQGQRWGIQAMVGRVSESEGTGISPKAHHQLLSRGTLVLPVVQRIILEAR